MYIVHVCVCIHVQACFFKMVNLLYEDMYMYTCTCTCIHVQACSSKWLNSVNTVTYIHFKYLHIGTCM